MTGQVVICTHVNTMSLIKQYIYDMNITETTGIKYQRNLKFVLYNEVVYLDGEVIGAIYEDKENGGFSIKKIIETETGPDYQFVGNFTTVSDAKEFINNAGTL